MHQQLEAPSTLGRLPLEVFSLIVEECCRYPHTIISSPTKIPALDLRGVCRLFQQQIDGNCKLYSSFSVDFGDFYPVKAACMRLSMFLQKSRDLPLTIMLDQHQLSTACRCRPALDLLLKSAFRWRTVMINVTEAMIYQTLDIILSIPMPNLRFFSISLPVMDMEERYTLVTHPLSKPFSLVEWGRLLELGFAGTPYELLIVLKLCPLIISCTYAPTIIGYASDTPTKQFQRRPPFDSVVHQSLQYLELKLECQGSSVALQTLLDVLQIPMKTPLQVIIRAMGANFEVPETLVLPACTTKLTFDKISVKSNKLCSLLYPLSNLEHLRIHGLCKGPRDFETDLYIYKEMFRCFSGDTPLLPNLSHLDISVERFLFFPFSSLLTALRARASRVGSTNPAATLQMLRIHAPRAKLPASVSSELLAFGTPGGLSLIILDVGGCVCQNCKESHY